MEDKKFRVSVPVQHCMVDETTYPGVMHMCISECQKWTQYFAYGTTYSNAPILHLSITRQLDDNSTDDFSN